MKLYTLNKHGLVSHAHNVAVFCTGSNFKILRNSCLINYKRMIARKRRTFSYNAEKTTSVKFHFLNNAVADALCLNNFRTERLTDCLMTKTNSKNRNLSGKIFNCLNAYSSIRRRSRSRTYYNVRRIHRLNFRNGNFL